MADRSAQVASRRYTSPTKRHPSRLPAGEVGVTLLEERGDALPVVLRVATEGLAHGLSFEGGGEVTLEAPVQDLFHPAQRLRRQPRESLRERRGLFFELLIRDDPVDEPDAVGFLSAQRLAEHAHLHGPPQAHHPGQEKRDPGVRDEAYLYERHGELGALGREAQVAGEGDPQARPVDRTVQRREYRFLYPHYPRDQTPVCLPEVLPEIRRSRAVTPDHLGQVGPGGEALPLAPQYYAPRLVVRGGGVQRVVD